MSIVLYLTVLTIGFALWRDRVVTKRAGHSRSGVATEALREIRDGRLAEDLATIANDLGMGSVLRRVAKGRHAASDQIGEAAERVGRLAALAMVAAVLALTAVALAGVIPVILSIFAFIGIALQTAMGLIAALPQILYYLFAVMLFALPAFVVAWATSRIASSGAAVLAFFAVIAALIVLLVT